MTGVDSFASDRSPRAYEGVVLASTGQHYWRNCEPFNERF